MQAQYSTATRTFAIGESVGQLPLEAFQAQFGDQFSHEVDQALGEAAARGEWELVSHDVTIVARFVVVSLIFRRG